MWEEKQFPTLCVYEIHKRKGKKKREKNKSKKKSQTLCIWEGKKEEKRCFGHMNSEVAPISFGTLRYRKKK